MTREADKEKGLSLYEDSYAHIEDELVKLDLLIQRRVEVFRLEIQALQEAAGPRQRYISHGEVDWLLSRDSAVDIAPSMVKEIDEKLKDSQETINSKVQQSMREGVFLALPRLGHLFALSPFELQAVIICLAPELKRKYDMLYAYLQDDITRKKPSTDLVLDLLCGTRTERWRARSALSENAPLFQSGVLETADDLQSPSGSSDLARFLKLSPRILRFLLGDNNIGPQFSGSTKLLFPSLDLDHVFVDPTVKQYTSNLVRHTFGKENGERRKLVLSLVGPYGVGKKELALALCGQLSCPMLYVDAALLSAQEASFHTQLLSAFREALLQQTALYVDLSDLPTKERDEETRAKLKSLSRMMTKLGWLLFLSSEKPPTLKGFFEDAVFQTITLSLPDVPLRKTAWERTLNGRIPGDKDEWIGQLARQFRLTPGQIRDVGAIVENQQAMTGGQKQPHLTDLYAACCSQSNQKLAELAVKISPRYKWDDLVLKDDRKSQLKEICSQLKHRHRVFVEWGFDRKLSHGKGLSVLFFGPPGTGKTMAAEVMASDLGLDLYKIDLSGVVSKYIGETEKNLSRIFSEAETSNAILFFDEADALFGKRTQVTDAHDRYANIETSYLLQKMEEYEGMVILATNLRENMDNAFTRRIRFIVEFPFPDATSRLEIWKTHFPPQAPLSKDIDYELLSQRFQITGGNIKNIVLNSAFAAAENSGVIGMAHIMRGMKREFEKIGKLWDERYSRQYTEENLRD